MKLLFIFLFAALGGNASFSWHTNPDEARQTAKAEHKYILLNFSGSDWCGPCMRMHKEIFGSEEFGTYAKENLVMVNADFPRSKKNQLPAEQQKINDGLAERYNPNGLFPYTLLLDADGNVVHAWEGFYQQGAAAFTEQVKTIIASHNR